MTAIQIRGLSKSFPNKIAALTEIDLQIHSEEILVLLGASGSGKSTLLRILAGLETPTQGTIQIAGKDVSRLPCHQRELSYLSQRVVLYPGRKVKDLLTFGLGPHRTKEKLTVEELICSFQIQNLLNRYPGELSGGERQRVGLVRAFLRPAQAIILDEPLASLDAILRWELRPILHLLQRRLRATMIYVTHDSEEARALADRIAILSQGRLVQVATPNEVQNRPSSTVVARLTHWPPLLLRVGRIEMGDPPVFRSDTATSLKAPITWRPFQGREVLVGWPINPLASEDLLQEDNLNDAFLFDAKSGLLLFSPHDRGQ